MFPSSSEEKSLNIKVFQRDFALLFPDCFLYCFLNQHSFLLSFLTWHLLFLFLFSSYYITFLFNNFLFRSICQYYRIYFCFLLEVMRFADVIPGIPGSVQLKWTFSLIQWNQGLSREVGSCNVKKHNQELWITMAQNYPRCVWIEWWQGNCHKSRCDVRLCQWVKKSWLCDFRSVREFFQGDYHLNYFKVYNFIMTDYNLQIQHAVKSLFFVESL
jgi:hypothetical protein